MKKISNIRLSITFFFLQTHVHFVFIMEVWNIKNLALPPIATYKANTKDIDVFYLRQVCRDAKQFFEDKRYMHVEYLILSRIVYRMKQKFRSSKDFKAVVKMYKTLDNYFKINMSAYINTFMELIPYNYEDDSTYLPTKNLIDFILVRHQGLVKLLVRIVETSKLTAHLLEERIHIGHSWQSAFTLFAIASRIYVLGKFIIQKTCDLYQKLYPFSNKLKNLGADWLKSDYQLPKDLRQWLNIDWLDVDDEVRIIEEPELPRIIDFFDLVDDDDVQFCDEYIILDESLINARGSKKHKHMANDSIKTLRGFDLEDEGEVIEVHSPIKETLHEDNSVNIEKSLTITDNNTICPIVNEVLDKAKDNDDNANSSLAFGNISAIANDDIVLNERNVINFHSTGISPDGHSFAQSIHDNHNISKSRSFDYLNNKNVCETSQSSLTTKHLDQKQNLHKSNAIIQTNSDMPANSTTIDKSVEILEEDVTIISVSDSVCLQDKYAHDNDVGVELSFENNTSNDITLTEKNVVNDSKSVNKNNEVMIPSESTNNKKQNIAASTPQIKTKSYGNTLPTTSRLGKIIESKRQKNIDTPSIPTRKQNNSTNYNKNMNEQKLNVDPKYAMKTNDNTSNISDFNVTLPTGYIVLSDSDDSDTVLLQNSILKQEQKKLNYDSENNCTNSYLDDGWYIDINKSKISPNRNYSGESILSSEHARSKTKKRKKKRPAGDSKQNKRSKRKRYYTMEIPE
ncbi:unnamed protein product [Callosobruchus maculatus]|uniref:Nucleolus and neural progenitor protein-like N-terminal domain-containing protein n=1 Tax=Callosobruchus maculatus TaxID=64391 RepID=A0A653BS67_CALMS|nr:unnamed protein product [Callosobruchus maculatus]